MGRGDIIQFPDGYFSPFSRLRTDSAVTLFDYTSQYNTGPLFFETSLTGDAAEAHVPLESSTTLSVQTSGDIAARQSRQYLRYQPGKGQQVFLTLVLGAVVSGVRRRAGYFDGENGVFLEMDESGNLYWVLRSNTSGTPTDTRIPRGSWNRETAYIDVEKTIIVVIDLQFLGVGRVRCGFDIDGEIVYCHEFLNAGNTTGVYMTTGTLPVRYEIEATDTPGEVAYLKTICSAVASEGGVEESRGVPFAACSGATAVSVTSEVPLISIRPKALFNGITNRAMIILTGADMLARSKSAVFHIKYGGALTGASWADVNATHSCVEYDTTASAISGGICIANTFVPASAAGANRAPGASRINLVSRLPIALDISGGHPTSPLSDVITVTCETLEAPDATLVHADLQWVEVL